MSILQIGATMLQAVKEFLMADEKINTVVVVVMIILAGIVVYLIMIGRKTSRLEEKLEELKAARKQNPEAERFKEE